MVRQTKIAHIATTYQSAVTILETKLRALDEFEDVDVTVISSPPKIQTRRKPAVRQIQVAMARDIRPITDLRSIYQLCQVLRRQKFDIVHSHTSKAGFISAVAAKMAGVPVICHTYHGLPFYEGQKRVTYLAYRLFENFACKFRDYVFTQNRRDRPECVRLMGGNSRVGFEGNGVDVEYVKQSAQKQLARAIKDFPGRGARLVLLSRLEPVKRVDDFFRVVNELGQKGVEVSCVVAGAGILADELQNQIVNMHLEDRINMVGFVDYPHGLIAASDIVVLCSEKEGVPRSIMEAMALEKPVVATDVLGTQELVVGGETGFLVPVGNTSTMAEKIVLLAESPSLRRKMGRAGHEKTRREFDERNVCRILLDTYKELLEKSRNPQF